MRFLLEAVEKVPLQVGAEFMKPNEALFVGLRKLSTNLHIYLLQHPLLNKRYWLKLFCPRVWSTPPALR